ncbi:MAG: hypothetical protein AAFZ07_08355 [Actinomycetota bacterium]
MQVVRSDRLATALVVAASSLLVIGALTAYARDNILDAGEFADRGAATLDDPDVRSFVAREAVDGLVELRPDLLSVRPILLAATEFILDSDTAADILRFGLAETHATLLSGSDDTVTVRLADLLLIVNAQVRALQPELAEELPDDLTDTLVTVVTRDQLTDLVDAADDVRAAAILLPLLALVGYGAAIAAARHRRRELVPVGAGIAVVGGVLVVGERLGSRIADRTAGRAAAAVWDSYAGDLTTWGLVLVAVGTALGAGAAAMLRPLTIDAVVEAVRTALAWRSGTPLGAVVRILATLSIGLWLLTDPGGAVDAVVRILGLVLLATTVAQVLTAVAAGEPSIDAAPTRRRLAAWSVGAAALVGIVALLGFGIVRSVGRGVEAADGVGCNGSVLLCDRPLDDVVIAATHNSNSAAADGYLAANHSQGIIEQLDAGYRGLLIDTWYGIEGTLGVVITERARPTGSDREELVAEIGEEAVAAAEAVQARQSDLGGDAQAYLCHALCETGATPLSTELEAMRRWLERHPREVLVLFIQDELTPEDTRDAFESAGLGRYLHEQSIDEPFPTLGEMIDAGRRVFVMAENDSGDVPWYHDGFAFTQETPFSFASVDDFSCDENRGTPDSPLFLVNHFVSPPDAEAADAANDASLIVDRVRACERERDATVTMVAVDFFARGDVLAAVDELNGVAVDR